MSEPSVTVVQEQKVIGWPDESGVTARPMDKAYVLPLSRALTRPFKTDAHFAQYATPNGRRLKTSAAGQIGVRLDVMVFDVDCEETHGTKTPAPDSWRVKIRQSMLALRAAHPGFHYYETRGGSRFIYRQPFPMPIDSAEDAVQWKQDYATAAAYLVRVFGIAVDLACADWTRLFRLPCATRTPGGKPEDYARAGDPANVAHFWFQPDDEDTALARELLPRAFEARKVVMPSVAYAGKGAGDGLGLLYHALRNRGDLLRPRGSSGFFIRCPNESSHTSGKTGDTSTVMYLPGPGQHVGTICCLHGHCQSNRVKDWIGYFDKDELARAEKDSGR